MSRTNFMKLFDYLDTELSDKDCDDSNHLTKTFLGQIGSIVNAQVVLDWLAEKGGYCDCEILANVEEKFQ